MSGITLSPSLVSQFSNALSSPSVRFLKVSILNESLVPDASVQAEGSLIDDLSKLPGILSPTVPAYVLARTDPPSREWLAIHYVPDEASVRDKMLYASTRASLIKTLGASHFPNSYFATSLADLTPSAYTAHLLRLAESPPLSPAEREMEELTIAERGAGSIFDLGRNPNNHLTGVGLQWTDEVEHAVVQLGEGVGGRLVVIKIDAVQEKLELVSSSYVTIEKLGISLPPSQPVYALFAWPHIHTTPPQRTIIFFYSCPTSSPIKHRMLYSSGSSSVFQRSKTLLSSSPSSLLYPRKVETSDPKELTERFLVDELGFAGPNADKEAGGQVPFAKPRGPARRRQ